MKLRLYATLAALLLIAVAAPASAQTVTAFKAGEQTTGMTKQCFYNALGNTHTRTVSSVALCPLSIQVTLNPAARAAPQTRTAPVVRPSGPAPPTTTGFKTGEQTTGMTKQCFYNALGNTHVLTVSSVTLCPLNVQVPMNPAARAARPAQPPAPAPSTPATTIAFFTGEQTTGMTKQCFYEALGNVHTRTYSSVTICPLSLRVPLRP
jgi:hypothetical protein